MSIPYLPGWFDEIKGPIDKLVGTLPDLLNPDKKILDAIHFKGINDPEYFTKIANLSDSERKAFSMNLGLKDPKKLDQMISVAPGRARVSEESGQKLTERKLGAIVTVDSTPAGKARQDAAITGTDSPEDLAAKNLALDTGNIELDLKKIQKQYADKLEQQRVQANDLQIADLTSKASDRDFALGVLKSGEATVSGINSGKLDSERLNRLFATPFGEALKMQLGNEFDKERARLAAKLRDSDSTDNTNRLLLQFYMNEAGEMGRSTGYINSNAWLVATNPELAKANGITASSEDLAKVEQARQLLSTSVTQKPMASILQNVQSSIARVKSELTKKGKAGYRPDLIEETLAGSNGLLAGAVMFGKPLISLEFDPQAKGGTEFFGLAPNKPGIIAKVNGVVTDLDVALSNLMQPSNAPIPSGQPLGPSTTPKLTPDEQQVLDAFNKNTPEKLEEYFKLNPADRAEYLRLKAKAGGGG